MYIPAYFEVQDLDLLMGLIEDFPLATLISTQATGMEADLIPFFCELHPEQGLSLKAHIAKSNPLYLALKQNAHVLLVFQGENAYISANNYASKQQSHRVVPTWNYRVVQVKGKAALIEDEKWLRGLLARLTRKHEHAQPKPWKMSDAPADFVQQNLAQIVGIELKIESIQGKFKLNQNKSSADQLHVAQSLQQQGQLEMARLIAANAQRVATDSSTTNIVLDAASK